jgi:hypothetical protein
MPRRVVGKSFEEETMTNHSKDRTEAAQFKKTQKLQPTTEVTEAMSESAAAPYLLFCALSARQRSRNRSLKLKEIAKSSINARREKASISGLQDTMVCEVHANARQRHIYIVEQEAAAPARTDCPLNE